MINKLSARMTFLDLFPNAKVYKQHGMSITRRKSETRMFATIGIVLLCFCQTMLEPAVAQAPAPVAAPLIERAKQGDSPRFRPDFGDWLWKTSIIMPIGEDAPDSNRQANPSLNVQISRIEGAMLRENQMPTIAANPGKNFGVVIKVDYHTTEPTKLFANLKLDTILPVEETQKLMQFHSMTWHFDNQSSPGNRPIASPGSQWITLTGTAPKEEGEFEFIIDVGLMPLQSGGLLKKLYKVKLVTRFEKPTPLQPNTVAIHSSSKRVAVGGMDGTVRLLNAEDGSILQTWPLGDTQVQSLAFTETGTQLAVGFGGTIDDKSARSILICSIADGTKQATLTGHNGNVNGLHFAKNGRLLSCGDDGQVMLWDAVSGQKIASQDVNGPATGLSYCEATNSACVVTNSGMEVRVGTESKSEQFIVNKMSFETRTMTVSKTVMIEKTQPRELPVDVEGQQKIVSQVKSILVPETVTEEKTYTVNVPVSSIETRYYDVAAPYLVPRSMSTDSPPSVIQLALPDLSVIGRWTPEGDRMPVGTRFNVEGSRIFVTTLSGISVLESKSMIELVDIREKDASGIEVTDAVHHLSPFYIADRDALLTPNLTKLVTLEPDTKVDDAYFDDLAQSAKTFREQSLEQAKSGASRMPSIAPSQQSSPGYAPQPSAPAAPKPQLKPLLAKVEADKSEVAITQYNFNELGLDETVESNNKLYQLGGFDHADVIVGDSNHGTNIALPSGFSSFTTFFGLQDNVNVAATFVIRGDGKTLYRSSIIRDHKLHGITLDVRGIKQLALAVETVNKARENANALWIDPKLSRELLPEVYAPRFEELSIKIEKFHQLDFTLDRNGLAAIGVSRSDPTVTVSGRDWKPKTMRTFQDKELLEKLGGDLDFARARVYIANDSQQNAGGLAYSYQDEQLRLQCSSPEFVQTDWNLIVQIPYRDANQTRTTTEPRWTGKWRVGVWGYEAGPAPKEVPPKGVKPIGVADFDNIQWEWYDDAYPVANTPSNHFVIVGERKFESAGGTYRIETISDDGVRIKLDDQIVIDNWSAQSATQNAVLVEVKPGPHKIRFEYFDNVGRSCIGVTVRCVESAEMETQPADARSSVETKETRKRRESMEYLRSIGVYLLEELNAPTPRVWGADLGEAVQDKMDANAVERLLDFPEIRYLIVGRNRWTAKEWERLVELPSLDRMRIDYDAIESEEFAAVATLKQLKRLSILGNNVKDKEVETLASLTNLQLLSLWYNEITDECLNSLSKMTCLREFHQGGTKITEPAMRDFQTKLAEKQKK